MFVFQTFWDKFVITISNRFYFLKCRPGQNVPNLRRVEIEITSVCNLSCYNCDRNCHQAPRNEVFSLSQMRKFVDESLRLNWQWDYIALIGGEPTFHPDLMKLIFILRRYYVRNPRCVVEVVTNGFGAKVKSVLAGLPEWISVRNSRKRGSVHLFEKYNFAPIDREGGKSFIFENGCQITDICGIGLNRFGYYPCGAGASVDRIFAFDIGIKSLKDVTLANLTRSLKQLCRYCGHFSNKQTDVSKKQVYSLSWVKALNDYRKNERKLSLY